jgi:hypothetical protein
VGRKFVTNPSGLKEPPGHATGDRVFVYHTQREKAAVGMAEVVRAAYADPVPTKLAVVDLESQSGSSRGP